MFSEKDRNSNLLKIIKPGVINEKGSLQNVSKFFSR